MASISATCLRFQPFLKQPSRMSNQNNGRPLGASLVSGGWARNQCPSLRTARYSICCAAKSETVDRVCHIVKTKLALPAETVVTPETTFLELGADSLDTVEIVMTLEEEFDINIEEEGAEAIYTIQEAADVIEELVGKKSEAQSVLCGELD